MEKQTPQELIDKYLSGKATLDEMATLETWYLERGASMKDTLPDPDYAVLGHEMWPVIAEQTEPVRKEIRLWPRIAVAAAAVATIVFGVWFYNNEVASSRKAPRNDGMVMNDVAPGKNTATLTLPNGSIVQLSDMKTGVIVNANEMKYNDGTSVNKQLSPSGGDAAGRGGRNNNTPLSPQGGSLPEGERGSMMLTASTPRGGTYQFTLPDGTHVWLNAASKISFPSQFSGTNRKILLSGEAYLEVAKNKAKPFIVESNGQQVEVLGTHFNISAYPDESNTKTTLLEGAVKVSVSSLPAQSLRGGTTRQPHEEILKPGEQATNAGATIQVKQVNPSEAIAWKNGLFAYSNTQLEEVLQQASRWYDITIIYEDQALRHKLLSGSVTRYDKLSALLNAISYTAGVQFRIEEHQVYVYKK